MNYLFNILGYHSAHNYTWDQSFVFNGEKHDFWEVVFVDSGSVIVTEEDRIYTLHENQIIFHAPMEFHRIRSAPSSNPSVKVFSFETSGSLPDELKNGIFTLNLDEESDFQHCFKKVFNIHKNSLQDGVDFEECSCRVKAFLLRIAKKQSTSSEYASESAVSYHTVASFMAKNIDKNLTVKEIANKNYMSESYLKYLFKKYAGISPKQYYNHLQIGRANELLDNGFRINEVANMLNFSSPNYFFFFYKKHTGTTPLKYKNGRG